MENLKLKPLFHQLKRIENDEHEHFTKETRRTEAVKMAMRDYPNCTISNRHVLNQVYFDSKSFLRSKGCKCFCYYIENGKEVFGEIQYFIKLSNAETEVYERELSVC